MDKLDVLPGQSILYLLPVLNSDNSARLVGRTIAGIPGWHSRAGVPILSPLVKDDGAFGQLVDKDDVHS